MSFAFSEGLSVNVSLRILSEVVIFSSLRFPIIPNHFLKIIMPNDRIQWQPGLPLGFSPFNFSFQHSLKAAQSWLSTGMRGYVTTPHFVLDRNSLELNTLA